MIMIERKRGRPKGSIKIDPTVRKKLRQNKARVRGKSRIYIGGEIERWEAIKQLAALQTNSEVAKLLLDSYEHHTGATSLQSHLESNNGPSSSTADEIYSEKSYDSDSHLSSNIPMESEATEVFSLCTTGKSESELHTLAGCKHMAKDTLSAINLPLEIKVNIAGLAEGRGENDDLRPTGDITIGPADGGCLSEIAFEELEYGIEMGDEEMHKDNDTDDSKDVIELEASCVGEGVTRITDPGVVDRLTKDVGEDVTGITDSGEVDKLTQDVGEGVTRITDPGEVDRLTTDEACIAYLHPLLFLANLNVAGVCEEEDCKLPVIIHHRFVGSALYIEWICLTGHLAYRWCSQPVLGKGLQGGDLMCASAILASGNNYTKIALFGKFLNLHIPCKSTYVRLQESYIVPTIESFWNHHQDAVLADFEDKDLIVLSDCQMDDAMCRAQHCTYTTMEMNSKKILSVVTVDKRKTEKKFGNLQKSCFLKMMREMVRKKMKIAEVVTNNHLQTGSIIRKQFRSIKHSHDIWHAAKNLGKKIIIAGHDKKCRPLLDWVKYVVDHFWYTCYMAESHEEFMGIWFSVMHHVVNEHEWMVPTTGSGRCHHGPLQDQDMQNWLKKGSEAHTALSKIVFDKQLFGKVQHYLNRRSTSNMDLFLNHLLMYAGKTFTYSAHEYQVRNILAALNHNHSLDRPLKVNEHGSPIEKKVFNKKSKRWTAVAVQVDKDYNHIQEIMNLIVKSSLLDS